MNIIVNSLNGGEFTPKIDVRSDTEKYVSGCRRLENAIPVVYGAATKRPGTEFISFAAGFGSITGGLVAFENVGVCHENIVVTINGDGLLSRIICHENDIVCHENNIVLDVSLYSFATTICHENNVIFYENETVR